MSDQKVHYTLEKDTALIRLDDGRIDYSNTQDQGQDLRFLDDSTGEILAHEIEVWDETGDSIVWVKIPYISDVGSFGRYWMYYGNPTAPDGQRPADVWDSYYLGVWHMADAGNPARDSTDPGYHGTYENGPDLERSGRNRRSSAWPQEAVCRLRRGWRSVAQARAQRKEQPLSV